MATSATAVAAIAALAGAVVLAPARAWETVRSVVADGMRISFSVMPAFAFDPEHSGRPVGKDFDAPHRVAVQVVEAKTGRHVSEASVELIITSEDYASGPIAMRRTSGAGRIFFEASLPRLPARALYQVDVRPAGSPRVTSVHFDYRHGP